jgi:hypothetical protein
MRNFTPIDLEKRDLRGGSSSKGEISPHPSPVLSGSLPWHSV